MLRLTEAEYAAQIERLKKSGASVRVHRIESPPRGRPMLEQTKEPRRKKKPKAAVCCESHLLELQLQKAGFVPTLEYRFDPVRKWRVDVALVEQKLAIEIEGGAFTHGRHTRGAGFIGDMEKYNALTLAGWRLLRFTPHQVRKGLALDTVLSVLRFPALRKQGEQNRIDASKVALRRPGFPP